MSNVYLEVARAPRKCHFGDHLIPKGTKTITTRVSTKGYWVVQHICSRCIKTLIKKGTL